MDLKSATFERAMLCSSFKKTEVTDVSLHLKMKERRNQCRISADHDENPGVKEGSRILVATIQTCIVMFTNISTRPSSPRIDS